MKHELNLGWLPNRGGYLLAVLFVGLAIVSVHLGWMIRVAPLVGLGAAIFAFLFRRGPAILLLGAYTVAATLFEVREDTLNLEDIAQIGLFVAANLGIITMMERLRRTLESARRSERNHHLIAENTTDLILAYGLDRRLLYVNPAIERLLCYSVDEMRTLQRINWIHDEDRRRMEELTEKLYLGAAFADVEFRVVTKLGEERWFSATWGPLRDERGQQIGIQGVERDITERQRMLHELDRNFLQLLHARTVAEREREKAEQQATDVTGHDLSPRSPHIISRRVSQFRPVTACPTKQRTLRHPMKGPKGSVQPISPEPAPSHRPWASARARPLTEDRYRD